MTVPWQIADEGGETSEVFFFSYLGMGRRMNGNDVINLSNCSESLLYTFFFFAFSHTKSLIGCWNSRVPWRHLTLCKKKPKSDGFKITLRPPPFASVLVLLLLLILFTMGDEIRSRMKDTRTTEFHKKKKDEKDKNLTWFMSDNLFKKGREEWKEEGKKHTATTIKSPVFPTRIDDCAIWLLVVPTRGHTTLKIYLQSCQKGKSAAGSNRSKPSSNCRRVMVVIRILTSP